MELIMIMELIMELKMKLIMILFLGERKRRRKGKAPPVPYLRQAPPCPVLRTVSDGKRNFKKFGFWGLGENGASRLCTFFILSATLCHSERSLRSEESLYIVPRLTGSFAMLRMTEGGA